MDMWNRPHYRAESLQQDLLNNLKNVALPGTGMPLSCLCHFKFVARLFILIGNPIVCLFAALRDRSPEQSAAALYRSYLLNPVDWFSLWQLNCRLASFHSLVTGAPGFEMESKWEFLVKGEAAGVPISPYLKVDKLVLKNKNVEGGMGIHFFKNAAAGGDWIIQPVFENSSDIAKLLPENAPLSTIRIITKSRGALRPDQPVTDPVSGAALPINDVVQPLCCVFRAGRAGAATDHKSILYDVNFETGCIKSGAANDHWYRIGLRHSNLLSSTCADNDHSSSTFDCHPDSGIRMIDAKIADVKSMFDITTEAHYKLMPDVPIVGWDVALTKQGIYLLEANLSCNFFLGSFDHRAYFDFVNECFTMLDQQRRAAGFGTPCCAFKTA